jgi:hypothetical protein
MSGPVPDDTQDYSRSHGGQRSGRLPLAIYCYRNCLVVTVLNYRGCVHYL